MPDTPNTIYSQAQFESNYPDGIEENFWNLARNRMIVSSVLRHCRPQARVFDVGCGSGIVVAALRREGIDAEGAELGTPPVSESMRSFVHTGEDPFAWPQERRSGIDLVMACDVIEHVPEPVDFLRKIRDGFPDARFCLITAPAGRELWSNYDVAYGHYARYDRPLLRRQMVQAGMQPLWVRYAFHGLYPVLRTMQLARIDRTTDYAPPKRKWFDRLVAGYFASEFYFVPPFVPGTSVFGMAKLR